MKKLITLVIIAIVLMIFLIVMAFLYVDLSGHKGFCYDVLKNGRFFGSIMVNRYVTEDKVIYKSTAEYPYSLEYPVINEKLFLKKRTMMPLKFVEEANGVKGQKRLTLLVQEEEKTDFLFLERPKFITLKGFETGEKTMVFSPADVMLYMPVMEKYNFWKKGAQFFEIMVPVGEPIPPIRDKIEVRYLKDEYIPIMGRRVEVETFSVGARTLPSAKVFLSKYTHRILALEIDKTDMRFILVSFIENPGKRIKPAIDRFISIFNLKKTGSKPPAVKADVSGRSRLPEEEGAVPRSAERSKRKAPEEIFFESGSLILSGRLWVPDGEGPHPAMLIVPKDGPATKGQQYLFDSLSEFLSASGFVVLVFDSPGQGKSQGSFMGLNDGEKIQNITAAAGYLQKHPAVKKRSVNFIGYEGGGYLALKAASDLPFVRTCVLLGVPEGFAKTDFFQEPSKENIQAMLNIRGLGAADEVYMKIITEKAQNHLTGIARSGENFSFFMGVKVSLRGYREFIARDSYEAMLSFDRPLLLILGRDDRRFDSQTVERLKATLEKKDRRDKVAIFRNLDVYMGKMVARGSSWSFSINKGVLDLIRNWIIENGICDEAGLPDAKAGGPTGA